MIEKIQGHFHSSRQMAGQGNDPLFQTLYTALGKMEVKPSELKSVINTTQDFLWLKVIFPLPSSSLPFSFLLCLPLSPPFLFPSFTSSFLFPSYYSRNILQIDFYKRNPPSLFPLPTSILNCSEKEILFLLHYSSLPYS